MSRKRKARKHAALRRRSVCELLEDRRLLAVLTVDAIADTIDFNDGNTSLREAVFAANVVPGADEIVFNPALFAGGPATIFLTLGELAITDSLTVSGPIADSLSLDVSGSDSTPNIADGQGSRIFSINDGNTASVIATSLSDLTLSGGDIDGAGGAVHTSESVLLNRVKFIQNAAQGNGGALWIQSEGNAASSILDCEFRGNSTNELIARGGGIYAVSSGGEILIAGSAFRMNHTQGVLAEGGAVYLESTEAGDIILRDNEFSLNSTGGNDAQGGAAFVRSRRAGGIVVQANEFVMNSTDGNGSEGGAVYLTANGMGDVALQNNEFTQNSTDGTIASGGGAYVFHGGIGNIAIAMNTFGSNSTHGTRAFGGGLFVRHNGTGGAEVIDNQIRMNHSAGTRANGGGLALERNGVGTALIRSNVFEANSMDSSFSGIGMYALVGSGGTVIVSLNTVRNNVRGERQANAGLALETAANGFGRVTENFVSGNDGGIFATGRGYAEIDDNVIAENMDTGINLAASAGGAIVARRNEVRGNRSVLGGGGMILSASGGAMVHVIDSVITENVGNGLGGGVYVFCQPGSAIAIESSTIAENRALLRLSDSAGGGVYLRNEGGSVTIDQCTISENKSQKFGGGLAISNSNGGAVVVRRSTLTQNTADEDGDGVGRGGGAYLIRGSLELDHSILAGNIDRSGLAPEITSDQSPGNGASFTVRFTLVGDNIGSSLAESPPEFPDANGNLIGGPVHGVIDAKLGPLANNGGPVLPAGTPMLTHALLAGSPAIDAGAPAFVAGVGGAPEFDQRGAPFTRVAGDRVDIGAVEAQAPSGALGADFNLDGQVDGDDLLVWQRGVGKTGVVTLRNGDATGDGDVDASDLAVWRARFGAGSDAEVVLAVSASVEEQGGGADARDAAFGDSSLVWLAGGGSPAPIHRAAFRPRARR